MNRRRFLLSLPPSVFATAALASASTEALPRTLPVPGGVARVRLGAAGHAPRVRVGAERVLVVRDGGEWVALVGIALATKPGSRLRVEAERAEGGVERHEVTVEPKAYALGRGDVMIFLDHGAGLRNDSSCLLGVRLESAGEKPAPHHRARSGLLERIAVEA